MINSMKMQQKGTNVIIAFLWVLMACLLTNVQSQRAPLWDYTRYFYASSFEPIRDTAANSGLFPFNVTYPTSFQSLGNNLHLVLCILQTYSAISDLKFSAGDQKLGVRIRDLVKNPTSFSLNAEIILPTIAWQMRVRYMLYNADFEEDDFKIQVVTFQEAADHNTAITDPNKKVNVINTFKTLKSHATNVEFSDAEFPTAIFLTGFKAGILNSANSFELNSTLQFVNSQVRIAIQFNQNKNTFFFVQYYAIQADKQELLKRQWIYAQFFPLQLREGTQTTFFTPSFAYHSVNFMIGLTSFSIPNNGGYNLTITGMNATISENSFYNVIHIFNIWARNCQQPYVQFNQGDRMCYQMCPKGSYQLNQNDLLCASCDPTCQTCLGPSNTECLTCQQNRTKNPDNNNKCDCSVGFSQIESQSCYACHYSCKTCAYSGQDFHCLDCPDNTQRQFIQKSVLPGDPLDPSTNRDLGTCECSDGYVDVGKDKCVDICGDGKWKEPTDGSEDTCDDGNTDDNDGCSSTCRQQPYFKCEHVLIDQNNPNKGKISKCYYLSQNETMTIEVTRIQKNPLANIAKVFLKVQPFVHVFNQFNETNLITNISHKEVLGFQMQKNNLISFTIEYDKTFEGTYALFGLRPSQDGALSKFLPRNTTIIARGNNGLTLDLYSQDQYDQASTIAKAGQITAIIYMFFGLVFCVKNLKQLGIEFFFIVQTIFISFAIYPTLNPYSTSFLKSKPVTGWNQVPPKTLPPYPEPPVVEHMGFSMSFSENFNIMFIFPGLALLLYALYRLLSYVHESRRSQGLTTKPFNQTFFGKVVKHFKFNLFTYFMLFNMQQILFSTSMQVQHLTHPGDIVFVIFSLAGVTIAIAGIIIRPNSLAPFRKTLFHNSYGNKTFILVLIGILFTDLLLLLGITVNRYIFYASLSFPIVGIMYVGGRRPFKKLLNNIRLVILLLCLLCSEILTIVGLETGYQKHKRFAIGQLVLIGVAFFVTVFVVFEEVVHKLWKMRHTDDDKSSRYESENQEQSINQKVREAGFALLTGLNSSRLPGAYQMSNLSQVKSKSPYRQATGRSDIPSARVNIRSPRGDDSLLGNVGKSYRKDDTQGRNSGIGREKTGRKIKDNAYQDILDQSGQRYM